MPPFAANSQHTVLTRVEQLQTGRVIEIAVQQVHSGVSVDVRDRLTGAEREEVSRKVWWMLGLGQDLAEFYALVRGEARLSHVEPGARGRLLRSPTVFEDVIKTLLTTNITWSGTLRMVKALVAEYGAPLPTDPSRNAFPTPAQLAVASETDLRAIGLGYRARFVAQLAQRAAAGEIDLERYKENNWPTSAVRRELLSIDGIGAYAAASLLMLLGHYEDVPIDSWARTLVSREWYDNRPVGSEEINAQFARWGDWKGLAFWFWDWTQQS